MISLTWAPLGVRSTSILPAILLFSALSSAVNISALNSSDCNCYVTNTSSSAYYTSHLFLDYRSIPSSSISSPPPTVLTSESDTTNADPTSDFFSSSTWADIWSMQTWNNSDVMVASNATVLMINSQNNVYISPASASDTAADPLHQTHLSLRTVRTTDFQSAAEIDSNEANFQYLSARFLARVTGSSGACAGLFTYLGPSDSTNNPKRQVQEADIEILTAGPREKVQYTNQPSVDADSGDVLTQATVNASVPDGLDWSSWNTYRLDWTPKGSMWYVNGASVANISFQVPRDASALILNMWSDGGEWTGVMDVHEQAVLDVQWMEVVYNTSGAYVGPNGGSKRKRGMESLFGSGSESESLLERSLSSWSKMGMMGKRAEGCKVVCSIDKGVNSSSVGTPQVLPSSGAAGNSHRMFLGCWTMLTTGAVLVAFWL